MMMNSWYFRFLHLETTPINQAPVSLPWFVTPPGDVAFFSRGTSNHFLHPSPDTMPHHTLGVPMCQTGRGVHARRGGLPAAAGTHWAHSSGHQSWVLPTSTSRVLSVTKTWRRMFWVVFLSGDSGSRPAQSFLFALHFYISAVFRCF